MGREQLHQQRTERWGRRGFRQPQLRGVQRQFLAQLPPHHPSGVQTQLLCHGESQPAANRLPVGSFFSSLFLFFYGETQSPEEYGQPLAVLLYKELFVGAVHFRLISFNVARNTANSYFPPK